MDTEPGPERRNVERALDALCRAAGLTWQDRPDGVRLSKGALHHDVDVAWTPWIRERDLSELATPQGSRPRVLVTASLGPAVLRSAGGAGVHVADTGGNGHLELSGLVVHVEGRAVPKRTRGTSPALVHRARVLYALLGPGGGPVRATRRELTRVAGVSLGSLQRHLTDFARRGWIRPSAHGIELLARRAMLEAWQTHYVEALRPELVLSEASPVGFPHFRAWSEWLSANRTPVALIGGQLGAALTDHDLFPATAALHVREMSVDVFRGCRVVPARGGPVTLLSMLGTDDGARRSPGLAHELLILGELACDEDPRIGVVRRALLDDLAVE